MSRYYFDLRDGFGNIRARAGLQFNTLRDVEKEIGRILGDVIRDSLDDGCHGHIGVSVRDEDGTVVCAGNVLFSIQCPGRSQREAD